MLGQVKAKYVWTCRGVLPPRQMRQLALMIVKAAGMTPARRCRIDRYPYGGSWWFHFLYLLGHKIETYGGNGYTLYQPLNESYLIADSYTDLGETEILISTCKPDRMNHTKVLDLLGKIGPTVRVL